MSKTQKDLELIPDEAIPESVLAELSNGKEDGEEEEEE